MAVGAAVVAGAVGATLLLGFDGGGSSAAPERVEMVQSGDGSTTDDAAASSDPDGGSGPGDGPPPEPPAPPSLVGTVRLLADGVAVERTVTLTLSDTDGDVVATRTVDATDGGTAFAFSDVAPGDYALALFGPGIVTRTTGTLTVPADGTALDVGTEDLVATTTVTGTVLGISADTTQVVPIVGASITVPNLEPTAPDGGRPGYTRLLGSATFDEEIRSAAYGAAGGLDPIEVEAPGYETRAFLPAPGLSLSGVEEVLRPSADPVFLLHPSLTRLGATVGDVGLDPSPRPVTIDASLLGGTGATRTFRFELRGGTVAGQPVRLTGGTLSGTIATAEATLSAGGTTAFDLGEVPVGAYTLVAVPATGDRIDLRGVSVDAGDASVDGSGPAFTLVVPPGAGAIELTATVRARSLISGTIQGFDLVPLQVSPLDGATVTVAGSGSGSARVDGGSTSTDADGSFSLEVDAADYAVDAITVVASGYETRSLGGAVSDPATGLPGTTGFLLYPATPGADELLLNPEPRTVTVDVELTSFGVATTTRSVTVELLGGEFAPDVAARLPDGSAVGDLDGVPGTGAAGSVVSTAGLGRFTFSGVPVGAYTLRISGDHVRTVEQPVVVAPAADALAVGTVPVTARSKLTLTVRAPQFDADVDDLVDGPLAAAAVELASSLAASDGRDAVTAPASLVTGADGKFTVWIDAGTHAADAVRISAPGYSEEQVGGDLRASVIEPDDVDLPALPRNVTGTLDLSGPTGVTRDVVVELWAGDVSDFSTGAPVDSVLIASAIVGPNTFMIEDVAPVVGGYTLRAVGGDLAGTDTFQVTESVASLMASPGSEPLALTGATLSVTARTRLTLTATGIQRVLGAESLTDDDEPLEGVAVSVPAGGSTVFTDDDGTLVVDLDAGDYSDGALGEIGLTRSGYEGASLSGELTAVTEVRTVVLDPSDTAFAIDLGLLGDSEATRTVTLTVTPTAGGAATFTASELVLSVDGGPFQFTSGTTLPIGRYTFEVSGTGVATRTVERGIGPTAGAFAITSIDDIQATVTVSGTLVEDAATGSDGTRDADEALPVEGATVTGPGGVSDTSDAEGAFILVLDSGASAPLTIVADGFAEATPVLTVGASLTQDVEPFTLTRDVDIRVEGEISASVTGVTAMTDGGTPVPATLSDDGSRYALTGLTTGPVWRIDFSTSAGVVISRYVQSDDPIAIVLDQDAEVDDVGAITVTLEVGQDPSVEPGQERSVRVTLTETVPSKFFTIPGGEVVETVTVTAPAGSGATLDDVMTGDVTFSGLAVFESSPSIPEERFTLLVEALDAGADPGTAYQWEQDAGADAGTAEDVGVEIPRTPGSAAAVTKPFRFVRAPSAVQVLEAAVKDPDNDVAGGTVRLTWQAPAGSGGATELRYDVQQGSSAVTGCEGLTVLTCTVGGLDDGEEYTFTVVARNAAISALSASKSISATPRDVPDAPADVTAARSGDGGATIAWTKPDDGGSTIIDYTVTSSPGGPTCTVTTTGCTIASGFDPGTEYTFTVTAHNAAGSSVASDPSNEVIVEEPLCAEGGACAIGDTGPGGGIVFYVAPDGGTFTATGTACDTECRYLEAWTADEGQFQWKTSETSTSGTSKAIGHGYQNTYTAMAGEEHPAAEAARNATHGGKNDWFLPSKDELNQMYVKSVAIGGFDLISYWSSSENNASGAWRQDFDFGLHGNFTKTSSGRVRLVRAF